MWQRQYTSTRSSSLSSHMMRLFCSVALSSTAAGVVFAAAFVMPPPTTLLANDAATTLHTPKPAKVARQSSQPFFHRFMVPKSYPFVSSSTSSSCTSLTLAVSRLASAAKSSLEAITSHQSTCACEPNTDQTDKTNDSDEHPIGSQSPQVHIPEGFEIMEIPEWGTLEGHAIFGGLLEQDKIEQYIVLKRQNSNPSPPTKNNLLNNNNNNNNHTCNETTVVMAQIQLGQRVNGHPGIVHGGILSLLFDDCFGFAFVALGITKAFTANLSIDYRAPVPAGSLLKLSVQFERQEGRKLYWNANMTNPDGSILYAQATSLFIIPRSEMEEK